MLKRCYNKKSTYYAYYGGRGINVCERWRESFENFLSDMGQAPDGMSLDRFPNMNGGYEPGNCRWATAKEQGRNKRNNVFIEYSGKRQTLSQWSEETGIPRTTISSRIEKLKWPIERALTEPLRPHRPYQR
jgi:hypothetical protein